MPCSGNGLMARWRYLHHLPCLYMSGLIPLPNHPCIIPSSDISSTSQVPLENVAHDNQAAMLGSIPYGVNHAVKHGSINQAEMLGNGVNHAVKHGGINQAEMLGNGVNHAVKHGRLQCVNEADIVKNCSLVETKDVVEIAETDMQTCTKGIEIPDNQRHSCKKVEKMKLQCDVEVNSQWSSKCCEANVEVIDKSKNRKISKSSGKVFEVMALCQVENSDTCCKLERNSGSVSNEEHNEKVCWMCETNIECEQKICCGKCRIYYHVNFMGLSEQVKHALGESRVVWICHRCGHSNYSECLFHDFGIPADGTTYDSMRVDGDCFEQTVAGTESGQINVSGTKIRRTVRLRKKKVESMKREVEMMNVMSSVDENVFGNVAKKIEKHELRNKVQMKLIVKKERGRQPKMTNVILKMDVKGGQEREDVIERQLM